MFADFFPRPLIPAATAAGAAEPPIRFVTAVTLPAPPAAVFRLLADIESLPRWAPDFCERMDLERGGWHALTTVGEVSCTLTADEHADAVELRFGTEPGGTEIRLPLRIIRLSGGGTLVTLTMVQARGHPDGQFERQRGALLSALKGLTVWFAAGPRPGRSPRPELARRSRAPEVNPYRRPST